MQGTDDLPGRKPRCSGSQYLAQTSVPAGRAAPGYHSRRHGARKHRVRKALRDHKFGRTWVLRSFCADGRKAGCCAYSQIEATSRLISLALRSGVKVESVIRQLVGIRCPSPTWRNGERVVSCSDGIAKVLNHNAQAHIGARFNDEIGTCPDCGAAVEHEGGCIVCRSCGFSRCA